MPWSARRLADRLAMSETTVWRIWQSVGLKPHRVDTFKFSTDPDLVAKIRDVVGLYLANWNIGATPFVWVKTADEILAKAVRKRPANFDSRH